MRARRAGFCGSGGPVGACCLLVEVVRRGEEDGDAVATWEGKDAEGE